MTISIARIPRRLKSYASFLLGILLASLLPMTLVLVISYDHLIEDAKALLDQRAQRAHQEISLLLADAEVQLTQISTAVVNGDPEILDRLQHAEYRTAYFREAGVIDESGYLVITNLGRVDPPVYVAPNQRSDPAVSGMQLIGPHLTSVMEERSVILSMPTRGQGEVNLLVNPKLLLYMLNILKGTDLGPDGYIAFIKPDGQIIAAVGALPGEGMMPAETGAGRIQAELETPDGLVRVVGQISTDWILRYWHKLVLFTVALTVLSSGVLFLIFFLFFRRAQALDFDIKAGLKNNEFELHYQPIVNIETGACVGSEALIRWRHPDEGVLLPGLFIPSAEKTGLINPIGDWIVRQAIQDQSKLIDRYSLGYISINLSPIQLNSGSFDATLKWLADAPVTPEKILIEVTEKEMIRHSHTTAMDTLARLRKLGCGVALDDFGVGHSNLSNLAKLEFSHIKIDMQFVQGINRDIRTNSILEAIVKLGQKLDVKIIAEGVETEEQRLYLQELGVRYVQGWLFSRALPIGDFENYLAGQED